MHGLHNFDHMCGHVAVGTVRPPSLQSDGHVSQPYPPHVRRGVSTERYFAPVRVVLSPDADRSTESVWIRQAQCTATSVYLDPWKLGSPYIEARRDGANDPARKAKDPSYVCWHSNVDGLSAPGCATDRSCWK